MVEQNYMPKQGDIVFLDYDKNTVGNEQQDRRPALVVSSYEVNNYTKLPLVCPITNSGQHYPFHVKLSPKQITKGRVMPEQLKASNTEERKYKYIETIKEKELQEVLNTLKWLFLF